MTQGNFFNHQELLSFITKTNPRFKHCCRLENELIQVGNILLKIRSKGYKQ